jgi:hypothetical protein
MTAWLGGAGSGGGLFEVEIFRGSPSLSPFSNSDRADLTLPWDELHTPLKPEGLRDEPMREKKPE